MSILIAIGVVIGAALIAIRTSSHKPQRAM